jgi:hypothetical protein
MPLEIEKPDLVEGNVRESKSSKTYSEWEKKFSGIDGIG